MSLKMIVTMKQVPDTNNITTNAMTSEGRVNRGALPAIVNPEDLNALEGALQIRDSFGGKITVISMGPPSASEALMECYYRGADRVILLSDMGFAGADTLATSYALKQAINKLGGFDLLFCGRQAIDGDTAQVGPQLAEKLGVNQLTFVSQIIKIDEKNGGSVTVRRSTEYGYEILRSRFPVLITVMGTANIPRPPHAKRVLAYKNSVFTQEGDVHKGDPPHFPIWDINSVQAEPGRCGLQGSPTKVKKIEFIQLAASQVKQLPPTDEGVMSLIHELREDHIIG